MSAKKHMTVEESMVLIAQQEAQLEKLLALNSQLEATIAQLTTNSENQTKIIEELTKTIKELNERIAKLEEQINKNSHNSSKPPSSDGLRKPPANNRKPSGKKAGGRMGHPGSSLNVEAKTTNIIEHKPKICENCPHWDVCKGLTCVGETRSVVDISVDVIVTEHKALEIRCQKLNGEVIRGDFPQNVSATIQYGTNLQALAASLCTVGAVSFKRAHEILQGVFNVPISIGTISNIVHRTAEAVTPAYEVIKDGMIASEYGHFDETGTRLDGKVAWVHVASNVEYTYLDISPKRGKVGMDQCGILPNFHGIAVHDCWKPYWRYPNISEHALCCAHLLRELNGVIENHPKQFWAAEMIDLLLKMKNAAENATAAGKEKLSDSYLKKLSNEYDVLIAYGKRENPLPAKTNSRGRPKKGKVRALIDRLEANKGAVCLFLTKLGVPFDNNQAERDIRMVKTKTKVSGCFRTETGARDYLKIMSYVGTAHKRGLNAYEAICNALNGNPGYIFQTGF